jgi:hypothetical protein
MRHARFIGLRLLAPSVLTFLMVIAGGCSTTGSPTAVDPTLDELVEASATVPAFAGLQVEEASQGERPEWTVFLFDESRREAARQVLQEIFGERASFIRLATRPDKKQVESDVVDQVSDTLLEVNGVVGAGYGGPGHLKVYVAEVGAVRRVQEAVPELPVVREAVVIEATGRIEFL